MMGHPCQKSNMLLKLERLTIQEQRLGEKSGGENMYVRIYAYI
jgi:hypothetical protein